MEKRSVRSVRFIAAERSAEELASVAAEVSFSDGAPDVPALARDYLARVLEQDAALSFAPGAEPTPEVELRDVQPSPLTGTSVVRFDQVRSSIPIFGSHMVVEVDAGGALVGVQADVAAVQGTSPTPTVAPEAAAASIAALAGVDAAALQVPAAPTLTFFCEEDADRWHLAWLFKHVPVEPAREAGASGCRGHGGSPRRSSPRFDYLVDAHTGEVVFHYSTAPRARSPAIPIKCTGPDELGVEQEFFGQAVAGGFELSDPMRRLRTFDLAGGDISVEPIKLPKAPLRSEAAAFAAKHRAAVSAHVNVGRVLDFYRTVLMRDSVDDKGMEIQSIVNCISSGDDTPPNWSNAVWWNGRMWYGQVHGPNGEVRSFSAFLDVIAHELTHGVIESSANLIYKNESGALNESLCDIFGVIVSNWYRVGADSDPGGWSWEFGPGLGDDGKPIRDLSDPSRTGDPASMAAYVHTREDEGGVHSNSNIHNKAAYHLLTAEDAQGRRRVTAREAAILYYLCLVRLPQRAGFARALRGLLDVATTYFAGDAAERERKLAAIRGAYKKVGITLDD